MDDEPLPNPGKRDERTKGWSKFGIRYGAERRCNNTLRYHKPEQSGPRWNKRKTTIKLDLYPDNRKSLFDVPTNSRPPNRRLTDIYLPGFNDGPVLRLFESLAYSINKQYRWKALEQVRLRIECEKDDDDLGLTNTPTLVLEESSWCNRHFTLGIRAPGLSSPQQSFRHMTWPHPGRCTWPNVGALIMMAQQESGLHPRNKTEQTSVVQDTDQRRPQHRSTNKFVAPAKPYCGDRGSNGRWSSRSSDQPIGHQDMPVVYLTVERPLDVKNGEYPLNREAYAHLEDGNRYRKSRVKRHRRRSFKCHRHLRHSPKENWPNLLAALRGEL